MKYKQRTFFEIVKRFFQPVFVYRKVSIKAAFPAICGSFISIYIVYLLKDIINGLQGGFSNDMRDLILLFLALVIIYLIILIIARNWTHVVLRPTFRKFMYRTYIQEFIYLDNNEIEKL
jgi:hypothetical protein